MSRRAARGSSGPSVFLRMILHRIPPDSRAEVEEVFRLGRSAGATVSDVAVFLYLVREAAVEWRHVARRMNAMEAERGSTPEARA